MSIICILNLTFKQFYFWLWYLDEAFVWHSQRVSQSSEDSRSKNAEMDPIVCRIAGLCSSVGNRKLDLRMFRKIFPVDFEVGIGFVVFGFQMIQRFQYWQMVEQQGTHYFWNKNESHFILKKSTCHLFVFSDNHTFENFIISIFISFFWFLHCCCQQTR